MQVTKIRPIVHFVGLLLLVILPQHLQAQRNVSGYVYDEQNAGIPAVNIVVRENGRGTLTDARGRYFLTLQEGEYTLVFTSLGYEEHRLSIVVKDSDIVKHVWLKTSVEELDAFVVKAEKRDPAYGIIKKASERRDSFKVQVSSIQSSVYLKATEVITERERKKRRRAREDAKENQETNADNQNPDPFEVEAEKKPKPLINMLEMEMTLHYQAPNTYKEERTAYSLYGARSGLYVPRFDETQYNFYDNLVYLKGISETPVISPLSPTAILTYKFRLEEILIEDGQTVYKIEVKPRKKGNSSIDGFIYINQGYWNINRFEFSLYKGALKFYDEFDMKVHYQQVHDTLWLIDQQIFSYKTKSRFSSFRGKTSMKIKDFVLNPAYPKRFFKNEIAVTTRDAYERDSSYWTNIRPEPLSKDEQAMVRRRDSIEAITSSQAYKDSVEALYNRVRLAEVLYDGVGFRKEEKRWLFLSSILSLTNWSVVGGWRFGPYASYFYRFKNGRFISTYGNFNMGVKNLDPQGNFSFRYRANPMNFTDFWFYTGRNFTSINWFDAYLNQLQVSNYILEDQLGVGFRRELLNGLFFRATANLRDRRSVEEYQFRTFLDEVFDDPEPFELLHHQSLSTNFSLSYTPFQRYITEPDRKVIVGSTWPTFTIEHERGWLGMLGSDVDYDYLEFLVQHSIVIGIFGKSNYTITLGKYVNTKALQEIDKRRFRQSDPWLYSNPLYSFQLLDTQLAIAGMFYELHYIHHFNGALINNVPLLKLTRLQVVAGAGALYVPGNAYRYEELFVGAERIFKLGARRRLKLGVFAVVANSSIGNPRPGIKFSLDVIDTWKQNWQF